MCGEQQNETKGATKLNQLKTAFSCQSAKVGAFFADTVYK